MRVYLVRSRTNVVNNMTENLPFVYNTVGETDTDITVNNAENRLSWLRQFSQCIL